MRKLAGHVELPFENNATKYMIMQNSPDLRALYHPAQSVTTMTAEPYRCVDHATSFAGA